MKAILHPSLPLAAALAALLLPTSCLKEAPGTGPGESVPLDRDVLPQLIPYRNVKIEQDPLKTLKETKGWEGVAKPLKKQIRTFHKMYPGYGRKKKSAPGGALRKPLTL